MSDSPMDNLLGKVTVDQPPPFALLHRPSSAAAAELEILIGEMSTPETLAEVPLPEVDRVSGAAAHEALVMVPYRQIAERGYACVDDGEPLLAMTVTEQGRLPLTEALQRLPDMSTRLANGHFDVSDRDYAELVRRVLAEEIGAGEGANFVMKRSYVADITGYSIHSALSFFGRLLRRESGAYWTYLVHTGDRTFVGASPERHVSLAGGTAVMNPISGTYRYPQAGPSLPEVLDFLADRKETDELYMVVDEELKMMSRICEAGGRVTGPYLKEMARLAHTEYFIEGDSDRDPRVALRETMFAPTVTGSPLESACRVIARQEPHGRGYYSGVAALIGRDAGGGRALDSSILIRTADIDARGRVRIGTGATLVRHSDPASEVAETKAKADGLVAALDSGETESFGTDPSVQAALEQRNSTIARYWLAGDNPRPRREVTGSRILVVDAEDTFTSMLADQLRSLGLSVTVRRFDEAYDFAEHDLVVLGPGPGDPLATDDPKIAHLRSAVDDLLSTRRPFLAVCLSHQVLSARLGLDLARRELPNQGVQRKIDLFGKRELVGFYNTFAARSVEDEFGYEPGNVEVSRDAGTGEVHALRGPHFTSLQFHAESVLTQNGVHIIGDVLAELAGCGQRG